ncbi:hypothetical protein AGR5A_Cc20249 [Agrobacterium genomosp. 5 str. CFBP 6626]|nr:hypothetical protein AGR5A_Cc20249 [Agrobacterium genomosp. 5 str. CFBP 6626]
MDWRSFRASPSGPAYLPMVVRSLTSPAITGNGSTEAVDTPLEIRKKQLVNRHWSDTQTNHDGRTSAASASSHAGTVVKTFGRRSG